MENLIAEERRLARQCTFQRRPDGRWAKSENQMYCPSAQGVASEEDASVLSENCPLCANWHPHYGCVLGFNKALDAHSRQAVALETVLRQAGAWAALHHFERAVARLEAYLADHPSEPEAYWALALVYDHPAYHAPDKKRAVTLYQTFVELMTERGGDSARIEEAIARMGQALRRKAPEPGGGQPVITTFLGFHRFGGFFPRAAFGVVTREAVMLAPVGGVEPASGLTFWDAMGWPVLNRVHPAFLLKRERERAPAETERLAALSAEEWTALPTSRVWLMREIKEIEWTKENLIETRSVILDTIHGQERVYVSTKQFRKAEQLVALVSHLARRARRPKTQVGVEALPESGARQGQPKPAMAV